MRAGLGGMLEIARFCVFLGLWKINFEELLRKFSERGRWKTHIQSDSSTYCI